MPDLIYPASTKEIAEKRRALAPEIEAAFDAPGEPASRARVRKNEVWERSSIGRRRFHAGR
jgi:hypothetical protein